MNLILLEEFHFIDHQTAQLDERQSKHIIEILKGQTGDCLDVGKINGQMGQAKIIKIEPKNDSKVPYDHVILGNIDLSSSVSPQIPVTLLLALPRPQMIKRILQTVACMGVEKLCLIHSEKVEKSFWQSPSVTGQAIREQLLLGLEQGKATQLPVVEKRQRLKHFLEDELTESKQKESRYIAHPGPYPSCPIFKQTQSNSNITIAIGPEGGFTNDELKLFERYGFDPIQLGERILKVETAVTYLLSRYDR